MKNPRFVGCSWFIGLIGLGFGFTQNKSTSTQVRCIRTPRVLTSLRIVSVSMALGFGFTQNKSTSTQVRCIRSARGTRRRDASATKAPAAPAFPAVVTAAASAAASETSRRRHHEGKPLRPPHPKFKPAYFVRVSCRKFKIVVNLDFLGC
jgi:hypothetical protein